MRRHLRMVLNVSFDGQSRHDPSDPPYYTDDELVRVVMGELESVQFNEDRPRTTLIASKITRVSDDEWDPKPGNQLLDHNSPEHKAAGIWKWINSGRPHTEDDVDELREILTSHGIPCPEYLDQVGFSCEPGKELAGKLDRD